MNVLLLFRSSGRRKADGILDYSRRLADALNDIDGVDCSVLVMRERRRLALYRNGSEGPLSYRDAARVLRSTDWAVLQYQPFALGRWGFAPWLFALVAVIERSASFAMVVHEPYLRGTRGRRRVMEAWQRFQLMTLGRFTAVSFIPTQAWVALLRREARLKRATYLPVGSNLPDRRDDRGRMRDALGVADHQPVLATFGLGHESTLHGHIEAALAAVTERFPEAVYVQLGADSRTLRPQQIPVIRTGWLPAPEVAAHLAAADIFLAPLLDGISGRRTGAAAAAQHGLAVVTTHGASSGPAGDWAQTGFALVPATDEDAFAHVVAQLAGDPARRHAAGRQAMEYFAESRDWSVIAHGMVTALRALHRDGGSVGDPSSAPAARVATSEAAAISGRRGQDGPGAIGRPRRIRRPSRSP